MCFFFQAEDGIRDIGVTGVQTCALPIYLRYVIGPIGEMAAPALKEGRGTLIGRVVGLGGFGFLRAGRLLKGAQPQWAQRSSGLYGHPGMPAMRSISA